MTKKESNALAFINECIRNGGEFPDATAKAVNVYSLTEKQLQRVKDAYDAQDSAPPATPATGGAVPADASNGGGGDTLRIECVDGWEEKLIPGQLYVFLHEHSATDEYGNDVDTFGSLVYWTGKELVYEDGEEALTDWDYLVVQDAKPNKKFIWY